MMNPEWKKLTGDLSYEEQQLIIHICDKGLKETRQLLKKREHETERAQTEGAILAFQTIEDHHFTTCQELMGQWNKLDQRCDELRSQDRNIVEYWHMRGQQLQVDFILERILAYRVITKQITATLSGRAAIYVGEWQQLQTWTEWNGSSLPE